MSQAGVDWDEKRATRIRRQTKQEAARTDGREERGFSEPHRAMATTDWMPFPALIVGFFAAFVGYFAAEASLHGQPHPLHWLVTLVAGVAGYGGGILWYKIRGEY
jgi:hypothetical protein